jgi:alkyl sulfatase BDS1-like metallo-beta-lactamase superfamily hydrolase
VLIHEADVSDPTAGATVRMNRPGTADDVARQVPPAARITSGDIAVDGDGSLYEALAAVIEPVVANFPVVTP